MLYFGESRNTYESDQALDLATRAFPNAHCTSTRRELLCQHPGFSESSSIVVSNSNGVVLASLFLIDCILRLNGNLVQGVFLSSVSVHPSHRGFGLSSLLINSSLRIARNRSKQIALVIARKAVDNYYTKFGFWGFSHYSTLTYRLKSLRSMNSSVQLGFVPATASNILSCPQLYDLSYSMASGSCERSLEYWSYIIYQCTVYGYSFDIMMLHDEPVGYVIHNSKGTIFEIATSLSNDLFCVSSLYNHCGNVDGIQILNIYPHHPIIRYLQGFDFTLSLRECRYGGHMIRSLADIDSSSFPELKNTRLNSMSFSEANNIFNGYSLSSMIDNLSIDLNSSFNIPLMDQI